MFKFKKLSKKQSRRLWLFTVWIVVIFFFTFMMLNIYGPKISRESLLKVPIIKSALEENPNVQINETFISKEESKPAIETILEKCGEEIEEMDLVLVELEYKGEIINAYFDPVSQEAICVFTEPADTGGAGGGGGGSGGAGGGGGAGDGGTGDGVPEPECSSDPECDDTDPYTKDACVAGVCENTLMTCAEIGGDICGVYETCPSTSVTASDGLCCLDQCTPTGGGPGPLPDLCNTDADCPDTPVLDFRCEYNAVDGRKECRGYETNVCGPGDAYCPPGCDLNNDVDCSV
jgi:hypothetical protein